MSIYLGGVEIGMSWLEKFWKINYRIGGGGGRRLLGTKEYFKSILGLKIPSINSVLRYHVLWKNIWNKKIQ